LKRIILWYSQTKILKAVVEDRMINKKNKNHKKKIKTDTKTWINIEKKRMICLILLLTMNKLANIKRIKGNSSRLIT
jgi:hypothetical protein